MGANFDRPGLHRPIAAYHVPVHPLFAKICAAAGWKQVAAAVDLDLDGERSQRVMHEMYDDGDERLLRVYSVVGPASVLDERRIRAALGLNWRLKYGAIAIWENKLVVTRSFLERDVDEDELRLAIEFIARTADEYEKHIYRRDAN